MKKLNLILVLALFSFFVLTKLVSAQIGEEIPEDQQATFDQILEPVLKIYNLVKYSASAIAALVLLIAGVNYMVSGSDPKKRENAKSMAMYVVIGLIIIWAAPIVVNFIVN